MRTYSTKAMLLVTTRWSAGYSEHQMIFVSSKATKSADQLRSRRHLTKSERSYCDGDDAGYQYWTLSMTTTGSDSPHRQFPSRWAGAIRPMESDWLKLKALASSVGGGGCTQPEQYPPLLLTTLFQMMMDGQGQKPD